MQNVIDEETPLRRDKGSEIEMNCLINGGSDNIAIQIFDTFTVDSATGVRRDDKINRLSPLLRELKIKITAYLDYKSLPKLSQTNREMKDFVETTWSVKIKTHQIYNLIPYQISKWAALPMTCNQVAISTICTSWLATLGAFGGVLVGVYTYVNPLALLIGGAAVGTGISFGLSPCISSGCYDGNYRDNFFNYKPLISGALIGDVITTVSGITIVNSLALPLWAQIPLGIGTSGCGPLIVGCTLKLLGLYCEKRVKGKEDEIDAIFNELKASEKDSIPEENLLRLEYSVKNM